MVNLTHHGYQRIRERFGARGKGDVQKLLRLVRKNGTRFSETSRGPIKDFIYRKSKLDNKTYFYDDGLKTNKGYIYYVYCDFLFIFTERKFQGLHFITAYPIPEGVIENDQYYQLKQLSKSLTNTQSIIDFLNHKYANLIFEHRKLLKDNLQKELNYKNKMIKQCKNSMFNKLNNYIQSIGYTLNRDEFNNLSELQLLKLKDLLLIDNQFEFKKLNFNINILKRLNLIEKGDLIEYEIKSS